MTESLRTAGPGRPASEATADDATREVESAARRGGGGGGGSVASTGAITAEKSLSGLRQMLMKA